MNRLLLALLALLLPSLATAEIRVPDEVLVDQDGLSVRLPELFAGRKVVVSFAFTTCTTICSPMTAVLGRLQDELGSSLDKEVRLVTVSLDPRTDTPERLREYADKFGRRKGWSFVTGPSERVETVLRALGGWVPEKEKHTPLVLVGDPDAGRWKVVRGLSSAQQLKKELDALGPSSPTEADAAARRWFTDTELVDQRGKSHRFYTDLVRGKKVLINFGFASCTTACSPITGNLARVQRLLGDKVGREVTMITITVDPAHDTPEKLAAFADKFHAGPGWYFLTGDKAKVEAVLRKLGGYTEDPRAHATHVLIGDSVSGNWVKAVAMSPPENLAAALEGIDAPAP